jgi:hypothetical protein
VLDEWGHADGSSTHVVEERGEQVVYRQSASAKIEREDGA